MAEAPEGQMARSGHGPALMERRLNFGHQALPSGLSSFPVARGSEHHRSICQKLPELWSDFSDRGLEDARIGHDAQRHTFHGSTPKEAAASSGAVSSTSPTIPKSGHVMFAGFVEFDMDGRHYTAGEMDRLMAMSAAARFPCSRPATFDEYAERRIYGLPKNNTSGREVAFVGPGATGCELFHTNTLGAQKCVVPPGDALDGAWGTASLFGRKAMLCVIPHERVRRQQSLAQFGLIRSSLNTTSGRLRRTGSLASLTDKTQWTAPNFASSSDCSQHVVRADQFFR